MTIHQPLISICIPAYKREHELERLLTSIKIQDFKDFEVVITDDSPDDAVEKLCNRYREMLNIVYHRNESTLGTPENWNKSIGIARGKWIKLMHDDDAFSDRFSLSKFASAIRLNPGYDFFFCGYHNLDGNVKKPVSFISFLRWQVLKREAASLLSKNVIGPPSNVVHKKNLTIKYDMSMQWLVDIDFYIRMLSHVKPYYIKERLIDIGVNPEQVTNRSSGVKKVEIPEFLKVYSKLCARARSNIFVYDAAWRLIRNFGLKSETDILDIGYTENIPEVFRLIIKFQRRIPVSVLRMGVISKILMTTCYLIRRS